MNSGKMVFIVDDDKAAGESVAALLASVGFASQLFSSAEEFLAAISQSDFVDVSHSRVCLVLDVQLPGMSGPELCRTLSAQGTCFPIILISGHVDTDTASLPEVVTCLEKPYRGQDLCTHIKSIFAN